MRIASPCQSILMLIFICVVVNKSFVFSRKNLMISVPFYRKYAFKLGLEFVTYYYYFRIIKMMPPLPQTCVFLVIVSLSLNYSFSLTSSCRLKSSSLRSVTSTSLHLSSTRFPLAAAAIKEVSKLERKSLSSFLLGAARAVKFDHGVWKELSELWNPVDIAYLAIPAIVTGPLLHLLDRKRKERAMRSSSEDSKPAIKSLIEYLEDPLIYLSKFPLWLFFLDVVSAFIEAFGVTFHVRASIPDLVAKVSSILMAGLFLTRIKDWMAERWIRPSGVIDLGTKNDPVRAAAISELTSVFIWLLTALVALEVASLKLGVTLGSLFACKFIYYILVRFNSVLRIRLTYTSNF